MKNVTKKKAKLIDWMICDDIRQENNGKLIFIGVYSDDILVNAIPITLSQLVFISKWDVTNNPIKKFEFKILQPNGKVIGPIAVEAPSSEIKNRGKTLISVGIAPFNIEISGEYKIEAKINEFDYSNIGFFNVLLKTPSEKTK